MCWFSKHDRLRVWPGFLYRLIRCSLLQLVLIEWVQDVRITDCHYFAFVRFKIKALSHFVKVIWWTL